MPSIKMATLMLTSLVLTGCDGALSGYSTSSTQEVYPAAGYYGSPASPPPGYYEAPGYPGPIYGQQPTYVAPFVYQPGYGPGPESWHEREWREHERHEGREYGRPGFDNESRQPRQEYRQAPQMAVQPRMAPPAPPPRMAAPPPPAVRPQADQNKRLQDQLGFRPSH